MRLDDKATTNNRGDIVSHELKVRNMAGDKIKQVLRVYIGEKGDYFIELPAKSAYNLLESVLDKGPEISETWIEKWRPIMDEDKVKIWRVFPYNTLHTWTLTNKGPKPGYHTGGYGFIKTREAWGTMKE